MKPRKHALAVVAVGIAILPAMEASAQTRGASSLNQDNGAVTTTFAAGSLVIPMDGCYQVSTNMETAANIDAIYDVPAGLGCASGLPCQSELICGNTADDGLIRAYGLISYLVRAGISVHWAVKPFKTNIHTIDFTITRVGGPALKLDVATDTTSAPYSSRSQLHYVGGPFVVDAADAAAARAVIQTANATSAFNNVDIHVAEGSFDAPIAKTITTMPKLAIVNIDTAPSGFTLNPTAATVQQYMVDGGFEAAGSWWNVLTTDEVLADELIVQGYTAVWMPGWDVAGTPTAYEVAVINKLAAFADVGGDVLAFSGAIPVIEGHGTASGGSYVQTQAPVISFHADEGVLKNGITSPWDNCSSTSLTFVQDASDLVGQWGGQCWMGTTLGTHSIKPRGTPEITVAADQRSYLTGVVVSAKTFTTLPTGSGWSLAEWRYKDNVVTNGRVFYLGGEWTQAEPTGYRFMFNSLLLGRAVLAIAEEVSRGQTIVATVGGTEMQIFGSVVEKFPPEALLTYTGAGSDATFRYPQTIGHLRAIDVAALTTLLGGAGTVDVTALTCPGTECVFDAIDLVPAPTAAGCVGGLFPAATTCRRMFTNMATGLAPAEVEFSTTNAATLQPQLDPTAALTPTELNTLISRVQAGFDDGGSFEPRLGGVNFSTPAVVGNSLFLGTSRPTILYVGAMDGMLHAICADATAPCTLGAELWAYIPRTMLPFLSRNEARIEGSATVFDLFGDFDSDGVNEFKTILIFQTGFGDPTVTGKEPAVIALDVTDPVNPSILWERVLSGTGGTVSTGPVQTANGQQHLAFITMNSGGVSSGLSLEVVDTFTGDTITGSQTAANVADGTTAAVPPYRFSITYADARSSSNAMPPTEAIPAGATLVDQSGQQLIDTVLMPSLYGELWVLNAPDGTIPGYGGTIPLFRFSTDFKPVGALAAVFSDGTGLQALIASGGFRNRNGVLSWSPDTQVQQVVAVPISAVPAGTPFTEGDVSGLGGLAIDLGAGQRAFAQPTVAGGELFVLTDSEDINAASYGISGATGTLTQINIASKTVVLTRAVQGGASSLDYSFGQNRALLAGKGKIEEIDLPSFQAAGNAVGLGATARGIRRMWLKAD